MAHIALYRKKGAIWDAGGGFNLNVMRSKEFTRTGNNIYQIHQGVKLLIRTTFFKKNKTS